MKIIVESANQITTTILPEEASGNYWLLDENSKNLLNVVEENGNWTLVSNIEIKIVNDFYSAEKSNIKSLPLEANKFIFAMNIMTKEKYIIYTMRSYEKFENLIIDYNKVPIITFGKSNKADIAISNDLFADFQFNIELIKENNTIIIKNINQNNNLYVNGNICIESYPV